MWAETIALLGAFESAVLTGRDAAGYPLSVRCTPRPDAATRTLRVAVPDDVLMVPGPTGLLCHGHDEQLWKIRSFNVRGTLERDAAGWLFRPTALIPPQAETPLAMIRAIRDIRRVAARYLAKRALARPAIPWDKLKAAKLEAQAEARAQGMWR